MSKLIALWLAFLLLAGCDEPKVEMINLKAEVSALAGPIPEKRWYTPEQVETGQGLFQTNCAECHGKEAQGTPNWHRPGPDGKYPPPPLNGAAHTWHHPLSALRYTVKQGGVAIGGSMPGFVDKLDSLQIDAVLAWVQSHWSDEVYGVWRERN